MLIKKLTCSCGKYSRWGKVDGGSTVGGERWMEEYMAPLTVEETECIKSTKTVCQPSNLEMVLHCTQESIYGENSSKNLKQIYITKS